MAPVQKRKRQDVDDEEIIIESASANSNMRQDTMQRKKSKISAGISISRGGEDDEDNDEANVNSDDESSSDSDMEDTPPPGPDPLTSTQYEIDRDAGFVHLQNIEDDDAQASKAIDSRKRLLGRNRPAESGIIEVITCINFMCHERLEVKLGPLINFVVGKNGSGKSALVAALQICLGVKASSTNRGSNLKGMIKNGRNAAMVRIQIANRGQDAYLPDQYGASIIVERTFTTAGASSFKLKSVTDRTISTKKGDVDDLIEHFQFQVENPMNILTQDNAKQFITKSGPGDKYKLFVKGTQLEQLDTDYSLIHESAENHQQQIYQQTDNVKILKRRAEEAMAKARLVEKHSEMKAAHKRYRKQSAWAQVEREERQLEVCAAKIEEARRTLANAEASAVVRAQEYEAADGLVTRAEDEVHRLEEEKLPLVEAEAEAKHTWRKAVDELRKLKTEEREIRAELATARSSMETYNAKIAEEESRLKAVNGGSHSRKLAELEEAKALVAERILARDNARRDIASLESQLTSAETKFQESKGPIQWKNEEIARAERRLQELNTDRGNLMKGYQSSMSTLLNRIKNDRGFTSTPIGPLGLHCRLLKPIWSDVLESSLGNSLNAFVVTSRADQQRLSNMARDLRVNTTVYIMKDQISNLNEPDDHFDTILRVLEIENILVRNALIINQAIEQTILIPSPSDAEKVLYEGPSPRNVKQCFSIDKRRRGWGIRLTAGSTESYGPIKGTANPIPRMKTEVASQVSQQQDSLNELRRELQELQKIMRDGQEVREECNKAVARQKKLLRDLTADAQRAHERVETLEAEIADDNVVDGRLDGFKVILAESQAQFALHGGSYVDSKTSVENQNKECTHLNTLFDQAKSLATNYDFKIEKAKDKVRRIAKNRHLSLQQKNESIEKVEIAKAVTLKAIESHATQAAETESFIAQATEICERVPVDPEETLSSLDSKISKLAQQLEAYRRRQGTTDDEIGKIAIELHRIWQESDQELKKQTAYCNLLKSSLLDRMTKWRRFQKLISAYSRMNFLYLLSERNFRGGLTFDHKKKLLDVQVEPDETRRSDKGRQTKTLSGGEKSFSSICLLLAMWEAMGAPLRILDEYDVFMDDVNREVSTRMLISAARSSVGKQFILITPNSVSKMVERENKDVNFISMLDPRAAGQASIEQSMGTA